MDMPKDFSGQNLRGKSFKGQNLVGANFSGADIRGTNFTKADLTGANFIGATAGLQDYWSILLVTVSGVLLVILGIISISIGALIANLFNPIVINTYSIIPSIFFLMVLTIFFATTVRRGLVAGVGILCMAVALVGSGEFISLSTSLSLRGLTSTLTSTFVGLGELTSLLTSLGVDEIISRLTFILRTLGIGELAWTLTAEQTAILRSSMTASLALTVSLTLSLIASLAWIIVLILMLTDVEDENDEKEETVDIVGILINPILAISLGIIAGELLIPLKTTWTVVSFLGALPILSLGVYIAKSALAEDEKHNFIRIIAIIFASTVGTNFYEANLTNVNFMGATLKNTNFRGAIIFHTYWLGSKKLEFARVGDSILAKASIRELLITGVGCSKYYAGENLQGANLANVDLKQANLREANISQANLQGTNLIKANLTKVQAVGTDFTNSRLTGACLEAWSIDNTTKLEQVDCQYVFLLEYPDAQGNRERHPHDPDTLFEPGDFAKRYKKIMNTVQILLRTAGNQAAFNIAIQKLIEKNPGITSDAIQAIEKKEDDVLVTLKVPDGTDKGKIERDFTEPYKLELQNRSDLLAAAMRHNQDIKEIALALITTPASSPIFKLTNDSKSESKAMNDSTDNSRKIENKDGNVIGNILGDYGTISGTVAESINQLPDAPDANKPSIKELLIELQKVIEADPALKPEDKIEALEQLKALAEAGSNPKEGAMQKTAKTALTMLKGIISGLPSAATAIEACNKLIPAIALIFGL